MTTSEFDEQVKRLRAVFGDKAYPDERVVTFWDAVRDMEGYWFKKRVTDWVGSAKPPMLPEIREAVALERERLWSLKKSQHSAEASESFRLYESGECGEIAQAIARRSRGEMSDQDWDAFMRSMASVARK